MVVGFTTTCAISGYPTNVVSSNPAQARYTRVQYYMIKFVSDLRQVGGTLVSSTNKNDLHNIAEIHLNDVKIKQLCNFRRK